MAILGLVSTETYDATRFKNIRRSVQYQYPNGAAVLTGLLSLIDGEETNDPKFSHWEKRHTAQRQVTASQGATKGPFQTTGGAWSDPITLTADASNYVFVDDASAFRLGHQIKLAGLTVSNTGANEVIGIVTAVDTTNNILTARWLKGLASADNGTTNENVALEVLIIGSAFGQGVTNQSTEIYNLPVNPEFYTQIFRTPFSFTGTSLKAPVKFDETGPYQDKAKEHAVTHMEEIEKAFLFGEKHVFTPSGAVAPTTGAGLPVYTTGGILYALRQWEAQYSIYRGGDGSSTGPAAVTSDSDDAKRIISNTAGTLSEDQYDTYLERLFRYTNNTSNEKLVLCGSGFLKVVNQLYRSKAVLMSDIPMRDTYGMNVVGHTTPFGTVYYKTHPLFTQNAALRYNALFLDVRNLRYRPMIGRDTTLLTNRQPNDADFRLDEWFTEAGLEVWFPESCMYLQNVTSYVP
jgi:hypothetical protein